MASVIYDSKSVQTIVEKYYYTIFTNSEIPIKLLCGQVEQESSGAVDAFLSDYNGGSYGLLQINKDVLSVVGMPPDSDLYNPDINIKTGLTYLYMLYYGKVNNKNILLLTQPSLRVALTFFCYNCGVGNFNQLFTNHLERNSTWTWNDMIKNYSTVYNWKKCLDYPIKVIKRAVELFNFTGVAGYLNVYSFLPNIPILKEESFYA